MKATKITNLRFDSIEDIFQFLDEKNLRGYKVSITIFDGIKKNKIGIESTALNDGNFLQYISQAKVYLMKFYKMKSEDNESTSLFLDLK